METDEVKKNLDTARIKWNALQWHKATLMAKISKIEKDTLSAVSQVPKKEPEEKETRGRQKGAKKNPKTGKFEMPVRADGTHYFYKWGAKVKIPKSHKK